MTKKKKDTEPKLPLGKPVATTDPKVKIKVATTQAKANFKIAGLTLTCQAFYTDADEIQPRHKSNKKSSKKS